jgi:hypothetical protein
VEKVQAATATVPVEAHPEAARPLAAGPRKARLQVLSGQFAGKEIELNKALTTLGKPGVQVAAITRRQEGFFIVHVESARPDDFPLLNGAPIGVQAARLANNDVIQLANVKMSFNLT